MVAVAEVTRRVLADYEAGDLITICAGCGRIELDGDWIRAPRATFTMIDTRFSMQGAFCPECAGPASTPP